MSSPSIDCRIVLDESLTVGISLADGTPQMRHATTGAWPDDMADRAQCVAQSLDDLASLPRRPLTWRQATVYVGPPFVNYVVIPWQQALVSPQQRLAFAEACWLDSAGAHTHPGDYIWRLAPERYGEASVAIGLCAATARVLQAWRRTCRVHRLRWHSAVEGVRIAPLWRQSSVWCVSSHPAQIMVAELDAQAWRNAFTLSRNGLTDAELLRAAHRLLGKTPAAIGLVDARHLAYHKRSDTPTRWHDAAPFLESA